MDTRERLRMESIRLLAQVKDQPLGPELEAWLNKTHPPGSELYDSLASLIIAGEREGWACNIEITGPTYRRSPVFEASPQTYGFSVNSVYMDNLVGQFHAHPNGEINMIVPLNPGAEFCGRPAGWTAPEPMSEHFPEVQGGAAIMLYFLPNGEITYTGR
ncbi:4-hydroxylaminobenzoate lyase [Cupriavidus sp. 8B]